MSYQRTTWKSGAAGNTLVTATRLNNIEQGILDNDFTTPTSVAATAVKGQANGLASLGTDGKVPSGQLSAPTLSGPYAARPSATSVNPGTIYAATDIPEMYRSSGTAWSVIGSGGSELGYAQSLTNTTTTSTTGTDVPGLTVTCVVGERPIKVIFQGSLWNDTVGNYARAYIMVDGTQAAIAGGRVAVAGEYMSSHAEARVSGLTPGSTHTFKIQIIAPIGGTTAVYGLTGDPAFVQVVTL